MKTRLSVLHVVLAIVFAALLLTLVGVHSRLSDERTKNEQLDASARQLRVALEASERKAVESAAHCARSSASHSADLVSLGQPVVNPPAADKKIYPDRGTTAGPAVGDLERLQLNNGLRRQYALLLQELSLTPEREAEFLALLSSRFVTSFDMQSGNQKVFDQQRFDSEVSRLLGADGYATFSDFEKTLYARGRVDRVDSNLVTLGLGLSGAQRTSLREIFDEEYSAIPFMRDKSADPLDELERNISWIEDMDNRILKRASSVLSAEQLKKVKADMAIEASERRAALRTQVERRRSGEPDNPIGFPAG